MHYRSGFGGVQHFSVDFSRNLRPAEESLSRFVREDECGNRIILFCNLRTTETFIACSATRYRPRLLYSIIFDSNCATWSVVSSSDYCSISCRYENQTTTTHGRELQISALFFLDCSSNTPTLRVWETYEVKIAKLCNLCLSRLRYPRRKVQLEDQG